MTKNAITNLKQRKMPTSYDIGDLFVSNITVNAILMRTRRETTAPPYQMGKFLHAQGSQNATQFIPMVGLPVVFTHIS
jgi:hypothetical protein